MSRKEFRTERKKENKNLQEKSKASLNKVYYWVIAFLFFVLFLLVLFIFSKSSDKVDLTDDNQQEQTQKEVEKSESVEDDSSTQESEYNQTEETGNDDAETDDAEEDNEEIEENPVNESAPYDADHAVDYNDGSADRIAIKNKIMRATGLGSDLIEYWVGNNGPGRVIATVASPDQSDIYEVELQYGEDEWHVTSYRPLDSIPENFN